MGPCILIPAPNCSLKFGLQVYSIASIYTLYTLIRATDDYSKENVTSECVYLKYDPVFKICQMIH